MAVSISTLTSAVFFFLSGLILLGVVAPHGITAIVDGIVGVVAGIAVLTGK